MESPKTTFQMVDSTEFMIVKRRPNKSRKRGMLRRGAPPSEASILLSQGKTLLFPGFNEKTRTNLVNRFYGKHSYLRARNFSVHTMLTAKGIYVWADKQKRQPKTVLAEG
jgi:hypothetical protein